MHTTQPHDPPADDSDGPAPEAAAPPSPLAVVEGTGPPRVRPRTRPSRPLSFVPIPENGATAAPAAALPGTARLRFVPMDASGDAEMGAEATVLPLRPAGWSEREPGWRGRAAVETDAVVTGTAAAVAGPGRPGRTRVVVAGTISLIVVLCTTALLRHLVERPTGAPVQPAVASAAQAAAPAPARATGSPEASQATGAASTPAPPPPTAAPAPGAALLSTPAPAAPRPTPPPAPSPRPTPATPTPSPTGAPSATPAPPPPSWEYSGSTGVTNACHGGAVEFGGCTYTITVTAGGGGTLSAVVAGDTSSSLKLKIRDAAGHSLATRYVQPGQASLVLAVRPGTYRVTVQELRSATSSFSLVVSVS